MTEPLPVRFESHPRQAWWKTVLVSLAIIVLVYLLILAVGMVGSGFKTAAGGKDKARQLFEGVGDNPLLGLIIGILATSLVQSSSTVTSVVVGLVAGGMSVQAAVPMVMGANIGTTVTNTLVSMGAITRPQEFRRAFAAATVHDFFNFLAVAIFLTLEVLTRWLTGYGFLEWISYHVACCFIAGGDPAQGVIETNVKEYNFIKPITKPVIKWFYYHSVKVKDGEEVVRNAGIYHAMGMSYLWGGIALIGTGVVFIFTSIFALGKILKSNLRGRAEKVFHASIGRGPVTGIISGTIITVLVQSSSTTTSLIVPMAGTGVMRLKQVLPFTLGANIGTTITALLASLAGNKDPELAQAMLQIALVHTFFNLIATAVIYGVPFLRRIPLVASLGLARLVLRNRALAIGYVLVAFFLLPLALMVSIQFIEAWYAPAEVPTATEPATEPATPSPAPQP